jgi:hypothetical protein
MKESEQHTPERDDPVWKLLAHASTAEPGAFFSRNVMREVRNLEESRPGILGALAALFRSPVFASGAAVAALVAIGLFFLSGENAAPVASPAIVLEADATVDPATQLEAVDYLGELMAVADPGMLTDEALADLFF